MLFTARAARVSGCYADDVGRYGTRRAVEQLHARAGRHVCGKRAEPASVEAPAFSNGMSMCGRTFQKTPPGDIQNLFETVNAVPNAAPNYKCGALGQAAGRQA